MMHYAFTLRLHHAYEWFSLDDVSSRHIHGRSHRTDDQGEQLNSFSSNNKIYVLFKTYNIRQHIYNLLLVYGHFIFNDEKVHRHHY